MNTKLPLLASAGAKPAALPAAAYHSFSMFDRQGTLKLTCVVKQLEWMNQHS
jgi:Family of unknown function (DUF6152)